MWCGVAFWLVVCTIGFYTTYKMLPILVNTEWTCTMDSFIHCKNTTVENREMLTEARNIAREMYMKDEPNPYSIVNLFTWLKGKWSIHYWSQTKYPTIWDIVIVPAEVYRTPVEWEPPMYHAMCIYDIINGEHQVFWWDNLYDVFPYNENRLYYSFR